jgi:serine/threonine-protein kinase
VIHALLGEGGFGQVWRATRSDDVVVAIKILHLELIRSVDAMTRFERELTAINRLAHRSVVRAFDRGTLSDGRPYLVLEYVEGQSLRELIAERRTVPPAEMLALLEPLCEALFAAHEAGLVHRDVKASNVIIGRDAAGVRPVLLDFGLVKLLDHDGPGLTSSRNMLGTPAAMAPEQMKGMAVDARTDVYAVGLLAYHMLTGVPAFGGVPGAMQAHLQEYGPRPRPSSKVDVDPAIDGPIGRALAPDPAKRFATVRELVEALRAVIHPSAGIERDVIVLYVEGDPAHIQRALSVATEAAMLVAITAPDSILAVATKPLDLEAVVAVAHALVADGARAAVGTSRAAVNGTVVDGPALDVESWAPYPLPEGLWIGSSVRGYV